MKSPTRASTDPIGVVIAGDHPLVREGLADIKVVAEATSGEEALELSNRHLPDVLLLDVRMPKKDGLQVMKGTAP
jgi:YesN/AraC family two-component response regulator